MLILFLCRFPEDAEKRKLWIWLIDTHINQKIDWEESMKICALHFSDVSFIEPEKLAEDAKPSIFSKPAVVLRKSELYVLQIFLCSLFFSFSIQIKGDFYFQ